MRVTDVGVPVQDLIESVKDAIKTASISQEEPGRDLRVGSIRLILQVIATRSSGVGVEFVIPFIGLPVKLGGKVAKQDTHEIDINLAPPGPAKGRELRDGDIESILVDAIETIRATIAAAVDGDDPYVLEKSTVKIVFGVTEDGDISIGMNGSLGNEMTQTLILTLQPAA